MCGSERAHTHIAHIQRECAVHCELNNCIAAFNWINIPNSVWLLFRHCTECSLHQTTRRPDEETNCFRVHLHDEIDSSAHTHEVEFEYLNGPQVASSSPGARRCCCFKRMNKFIYSFSPAQRWIYSCFVIFATCALVSYLSAEAFPQFAWKFDQISNGKASSKIVSVM